MRIRPALLLAAAGLAAAGMPASADKLVTGFNAGWTGTILSRWVPGSGPSADMADAVDMVSQCSFTAVPLPGGTVRVEFGGSAVSTPHPPSTVMPSSTSIQCEVNNLGAGGSDTAVRSAGAPGSTAVVSGEVEWPMLPLTVCASSTAGSQVNPRACKTPDVTPGSGSGGDEQATGFTCAFMSTNDPTGIITQDPLAQYGEINGGPFAVVDPEGGTVHDVTITCTIKVNYGVNDELNVAASRSSTTPGHVGVLVDTITYVALPGDDVYLCTRISWNSSSGHTDWYVDDDEFTNGVQCALATTVS